jgi:hypothetical protein
MERLEKEFRTPDPVAVPIATFSPVSCIIRVATQSDVLSAVDRLFPAAARKNKGSTMTQELDFLRLDDEKYRKVFGEAKTERLTLQLRGIITDLEAELN